MSVVTEITAFPSSAARVTISSSPDFAATPRGIDSCAVPDARSGTDGNHLPGTATARYASRHIATIANETSAIVRGGSDGGKGGDGVSIGAPDVESFSARCGSSGCAKA